MSCIFEDIKRGYFREWRESTQTDPILALTSTLNLTEEEATDALKIPESERDHLKSMIA